MKDAKGHGSNSRNGGLPVVRLDNADSPARKTGYMGTAKQETIAKGQSVDQRRADLSVPMTITDRIAAMTLGQGHPKSNSVPLGYGAAAAKADLWFGRNVAMARGADNRRKA